MQTDSNDIPTFSDEDEERAFWATHDSTDFIDWGTGEATVFPKLKPSTKSISLRLSEIMLNELRLIANKRDVPYQSLIKIFLQAQIDQALGQADTPPKVHLIAESKTAYTTAVRPVQLPGELIKDYLPLIGREGLAVYVYFLYLSAQKRVAPTNVAEQLDMLQAEYDECEQVLSWCDLVRVQRQPNQLDIELNPLQPVTPAFLAQLRQTVLNPVNTFYEASAAYQQLKAKMIARIDQYHGETYD